MLLSASADYGTAKDAFISIMTRPGGSGSIKVMPLFLWQSRVSVLILPLGRKKASGVMVIVLPRRNQKSDGG